MWTTARNNDGLQTSTVSSLSQVLQPLSPQVTGTGAGAVVVAAVLANLLESVLGATIQSKTGWLTNDVMNVIQISCAAAAAMAFACRLA